MYFESTKEKRAYIEASEAARKRKPTMEDVAETQQILKEFGIKIAIPNFSTVAEMEHWRHDVLTK